MDPELKGKCHETEHGCSIQEFCEDVNGIVFEEEQYVSSAPQQICQVKSNEFSKQSEQISNHEDIDSNESQSPHGEEFLSADQQCAVCDKIFDSQQILIIHALDNHPNDKAFRCTDCSEVFSKISDLERHRKTHDDSLTCKFCSKVFRTNYHLNRHLKSHTEKTSFPCPLCGKICKNQYLLQRHQSIHSKPSSKHSCKFCSKSFDSLKNLKIHLRVAHKSKSLRTKKPLRLQNCGSSKSQDPVQTSEKENKHVCSFCPKSFLNKYMLIRHLTVHSEERPHRCSTCNKAYKDKRYLNHHQKKHLKHKSESCGKNLKISKSHAKGHSKTTTHKESNKYKTIDVPKQFEDYILPHAPIQEETSNLASCSDTDSIDGLDRNNESKTKYIYEEETNHRAEKDNTTKRETNINNKQVRYKCAECDKIFKFAKDFIGHVKRFHHNDKAFKCSYCNAKFSNASGLASHFRIHKYKRNLLTCGFCSKSFTCVSDLKFHLEFHTVGRPYNCSFCEKGYKYKRDLTRHIKNNHLGLDEKVKSYVCEFCFKVFDRRSNFDRHVKVNSKTHGSYCLQSSFFNETPVEQETNITIKCKDSFQSDLSTKIFQNNKFSTENNGNENNNKRTKVNEKIYSDNESLNNDYNERNKLEICKTKYAYDEVVPPSVVSSTESKIQQKLITDEGNRIHKSTKKLYGVKRRIQISNKCAVCNKMFIFQRDLIKHAQEYHQSRKPLKCRYCKERFSNIQTLLKHSRIHKEIIKSHRCEFCLEHFSTLGDLKSHLSNHFEDVFDKSFHKYQKSNITGEVPKRNHICELCSKSFSTMYRLNLHLKSHSVRKTLACSFCEKTFKSKSNLHYHEEIHKGIVKRYSCEICSKAFRSQSMVARHMIYHTNERSYSCYQCKKTYKHKVDLKKHQKICLQSNSCSLCEKIFADNESLQTHQKVHYVNKCAVCNKLCNSQRDLIKHARQFHPRSKAFQCQTCSLLLSNKLALNIHRKICFKVKPCAYCDRIIGDDDKYKRHLTMHYVNKCAVCEKVCKSQRDLIDHAHQFHPNVKAFQCPLCDKLYASVTPFNCHTRTHKNVIKGDFLKFLYETKYKQNIDFELKFKKENGSNNMKQEPNNNQINENQHISKCYEPEVDSMNAEYLSDLEYTEQEVCQNDEDNAKETMNSIDIEILYNNTPDDELIVKNELDETNNEVIDIETIVPQVVDFEENFQQIESKQEIFLPLAVGMDLSNNEFIDIVHPVKNLEDNSQQNEPELHRIIEESPTDSIDVEAIVQPVENLEHNYHNYYQNKPKQQIAIEVISSVAIGLDLSNSEFIIEDSTNLVENLKPNSKKKDFTDSAVIVHPIENLEDSSQQNKPILQQVIEKSPHVAIGLELSKTEFIDVDAIVHPVENLEDNFENEPKKEQVIEKSPPLATPAKLYKYKPIGVKRKILTDKKCVICHKIFKFQRDLIKHAKRYHHNASAFKCKRCNAQFSNKQAVSIHYKIQHTTNLTKKYACKSCSKSFTCKGDLNVHIKTHLPDPLAVKYPPVAVQKSNTSDDDSSRTFICDICSKGFAYKYRLTRHLKTHTTERPYICSMCGNTYKHEYTLKEHEKTHLDFSKSKHACEVCFQTFSCASRLNRHLVAHAKECPYSCSICGKTFKHFKNMKAHETKHLGIDPIKRTHICEFCSKGFAAESDLKHHLGVHTGERSYTCSKCEKDFKNENALNKHLQNHVNKPEVTKKRLRKPKGSHDANQQSNLEKGYMCEVCSKTFTNMSRLHRHFKTHNVERPFSCSVCNKSYKHSKDLKIHEESHVISHICEMCNKTFAHRNSLLRHLKLHASCKCAICDMMCNSKQDLANHAKQYHPNDKVFKCQICNDLFDSKISLKNHMAKHKDNVSADHGYSHSLNDKHYKKKKSKLEENDIEESTAVATDDNQFVSNSYETNEENIVVDDDIDHTEELFANNEYYIEEITHTVNSQDTLEDLFIRIVTP